MKKILLLLLVAGLFFSCAEEEVQPYVPDAEKELTDPVDIWLYENMQKPYNCKIRWRWNDSYVSINYYVSPPKKDIMIPVGEMLETFWVEPFIAAGGEEFIVKHFPPEIVCVGSPLYNKDGTLTAGYADAGVRITLTDLNSYDLSNDEWLLTQLQTIHHEFTHIVHQRHGLPEGWEEISKEDYIGNSWVNLSDDEAVARGMITPYGTSNKYEDFADYVGTFLTMGKVAFEAKYLTLKEVDDGLNNGRLRLQAKYELMVSYYKSNFSIDVVHLGDIIVQRMNGVK